MNLPNRSYNGKSTKSKLAEKALIDTPRDSNIVIQEADKDGAAVIIGTDSNKNILEMLNDHNLYRQIDGNNDACPYKNL